MSAGENRSVPLAGDHQPVELLLPSMLVGALTGVGPLSIRRRLACRFVRRAGRHQEIFLPFLFRWYDARFSAGDRAYRKLLRLVEQGKVAAPRVFHAPFAGRFGPVVRAYYRDMADIREIAGNRDALRRECQWLGRVRRACGLPRLLYILHLGRRHDRPVADVADVAARVIEPVLEVAHHEGVILAFENVADHSNSREQLGGRLTEIGDVLLRLGGASGAPVGWTFDIAHALLAYRSDPEVLAADVTRLLPWLVHIHVNGPRWFPDNLAWADRHEAPGDDIPALWNLFRVALRAERFREFRAVTYEVNWQMPFLQSAFGGSPLEAVVNGYQRVHEVATEGLKDLDAAADQGDTRVSELLARQPVAAGVVPTAPALS